MRLTRDILNFVNMYILGKRQTSATILDGAWVMDEPTQKDKPSPHSSISKNSMYKKIKPQWLKKDGYEVSLVANTNSMEPLIDENCILVSEMLTGKWREPRLGLQPLSRGDIVVYQTQAGGIRIIHELMSKSVKDGKTYWKIKGYNNFKYDMYGRGIPEECIITRLVAVHYCRPIRKGD